MPSNPALLAAVLEAPDDDAPRLVYADWLDEHGDPGRGEYIRDQVERTRLPEDGPRWKALKARGVELLGAHREAWRKELPAWAGSYCDYERGFPAAARLTAREFLKKAAGLFRRAPIRRVELRVLVDSLAGPLAASPLLEKVATF